MRSHERKYDGYCKKCRKLTNIGNRVHDGKHFQDNWECGDCGELLMLPRRISVSIDSTQAFVNENAHTLFMEHLEDMHLSPRSEDDDKHFKSIVWQGKVLDKQISDMLGKRTENHDILKERILKHLLETKIGGISVEQNEAYVQLSIKMFHELLDKGYLLREAITTGIEIVSPDGRVPFHYTQA